MHMGLTGLASSLLLQLINFAQREGDHERAAAAIREIAGLPNESVDPEQAGNVAFACGLLARSEGRLDDAQTNFATACQQYSCVRDPDSPDVGRNNGTAINSRMLALALMERARVYEHTSREAEALKIYADSLLLMVQIHDRVNEGTVLHQMANCYSHLLEHANAYVAYVSAAYRFEELGSAIHLSNSLGELGYVLIDYDPGKRLSADLSEGVLEAGLLDMFDECAERFRADRISIPARECIGVLRKLFGMASLISFTTHTSLLVDFALALRNQLVRPLADRLAKGKEVDFEERLAIVHFDLMTALIGSLSAADKIPESGESATLEEIGHLADLCYQHPDTGWRAFRLFDWLAAYLRRCRGFPNLTATQLQAAAEDAAATGGLFSL